MGNIRKWRGGAVWLLLLLALLSGCRASPPAVPVPPSGAEQPAPAPAAPADANGVEAGRSYTTKDEVAAYLHAYGELPPNFLTKAEALAAGWDSAAGNLFEVTDGKSIGGDRFGNREGLLPTAKGRQYYECDINYAGGRRGPERLVYSSDGLIYYTADHYASFELLYPEETDG